MVARATWWIPKANVEFQYSLCRVVLMVGEKPWENLPLALVSVLALSSRFDGPRNRPPPISSSDSFSTRSVESF